MIVAFQAKWRKVGEAGVLGLLVHREYRKALRQFLGKVRIWADEKHTDVDLWVEVQAWKRLRSLGWNKLWHMTIGRIAQLPEVQQDPTVVKEYLKDTYGPKIPSLQGAMVNKPSHLYNVDEAHLMMEYTLMEGASLGADLMLDSLIHRHLRSYLLSHHGGLLGVLVLFGGIVTVVVSFVFERGFGLFAIIGMLVSLLGVAGVGQLAKVPQVLVDRAAADFEDRFSLHNREPEREIARERLSKKGGYGVLEGDLRQYAILHLACHGFVDPESARRSGLALAFPEN